jgi:hypothetical protein
MKHRHKTHTAGYDLRLNSGSHIPGNSPEKKLENLEMLHPGKSAVRNYDDSGCMDGPLKATESGKLDIEELIDLTLCQVMIHRDF